VETLQRALEPYRHVDPIGWVGVFRFLPLGVALIAIALGALMLLFGGRSLFRLVAGPLGALIATIWATSLATRLGFATQAPTIATGSTILLAFCGFLYPPIVVFVAFGVPSGLLAGQLAGPADWMLGFGPGFMVGGAIGVVMHRLVGAIVSSAAGAWVMTIGLMASLAPFVGAVTWLTANPVVVLSIAGCVAVAGFVFQTFIRLSPEEAEKLRHEKAMQKKRKKENDELEKRWSKYGGKKA
jgi:hypothetical protein